MPRPRLVPTDVGLGTLALSVMKDSFDPALAPLGPAVPDPDLLPTRELDRLVAAIGREGAGDLARYQVPPGSPRLRAAIARRAGGFGCGVGPDDLVITAGALEAVTLALRATCRAGQTVAIESPMYYGVLQSIEALGLRVLEVHSHPRHGLAVEALREALDEHEIAAVVAMPAGGNPMGSVMSDEAKRELVELLAARRVPLIENDALGDLAHDGGRPRPAKAFDRHGGVLWCGSLSKAAAPGLRVGWIAAGTRRDAVEHLQFTNAVAAPSLGQEVARRFLEGGGYERVLRRARAAYAERTAAMAAAVLAAFPPDTRVGQPAAGYCLWVELPEGADAQALYAAALRAGISITPGTLFSAKLRYRRFVRLNASRWGTQVAGAVRELGRLVTRTRR